MFKKLSSFCLAISVVTAGLASKATAEEATQKTTSKGSLSPLYLSTNRYLHSWLSFPKIAMTRLSDERRYTYSIERGQALVTMFLASWCLPCQQIIRDTLELENKYHNRHTRFLYVFAHDTLADAQGFQKAYKLGDNAGLAEGKLLDTFHQPELPSFYVGDRNGWMTLRRLAATKKDLIEIDEFLELHTAN